MIPVSTGRAAIRRTHEFVGTSDRLAAVRFIPSRRNLNRGVMARAIESSRIDRNRPPLEVAPLGPPLQDGARPLHSAWVDSSRSESSAVSASLVICEGSPAQATEDRAVARAAGRTYSRRCVGCTIWRIWALLRCMRLRSMCGEMNALRD